MGLKINVNPTADELEMRRLVKAYRFKFPRPQSLDAFVRRIDPLDGRVIWQLAAVEDRLWFGCLKHLF
jgi:hypothetical protein